MCHEQRQQLPHVDTHGEQEDESSGQTGQRERTRIKEPGGASEGFGR